MASLREDDYLLPPSKATSADPRPSKRWRTLNRVYKATCVTTKESLVILLWSAVLNGIGFAFVLHLITSPLIISITNGAIPVMIYYVLGLLMYPLAGFIGDAMFTRFKILTAGSVMLLIGGIPFFGIVYFLIYSQRTNYYYLYLSVLFVVPGVGLFQANVLQYGIDQLNFASSEVISSLVYWYYWTCYVFFACLSQSEYWSPLLPKSFGLEMFMYTVVVCVGVLFCIVITACCIGCCCFSRSLRADPGHRVNPVKLIWRVMHFVRKHNHPVRRSAFTYDECPSRMDLAKQRYGGPFTTEEVEDVKSFWRILLLLASLVGFQFHDKTTYIATSYYASSSEENVYFKSASSWALSALMIVMIIPIYQLIIRPCAPTCNLKMIAKMFLGLFVTFIALAFTTLYSRLLISSTNVYQNITACNTTDSCDPNTTQAFDCSVNMLCSAITAKHYFSYLDSGEYESHAYFAEISTSAPSLYWLAIPQALNGLGHVLVFLTALEFIVAQAPCVFRGFLIGLWYAMQSINLVVAIIGYKSCAVFYWEYYLAKTMIVLLSMVLFVITARKYKYRQLNEDADINVQQQIEQVFERNFNRKVEYEELQDQSTVIH